ncbi:MAG TPA: YciI family protein [Pseudonocardia sp.]|nr:YciI family protein [Pseudonocardia sp.]
MQYLLLLANAPDAWPTDENTRSGAIDDAVIDDAVIDDGVIDDWATYTRALQEAGVLVGGAALHGPEAATSVRVRDGRRLLVDGPFTETKEHLIGYYVIDVPDLDTAIGWAARVPNARTGTIEVRPVQPGSDTATVLAALAAFAAGPA